MKGKGQRYKLHTATLIYTNIPVSVMSINLQPNWSFQSAAASGFSIHTQTAELNFLVLGLVARVH